MPAKKKPPVEEPKEFPDIPEDVPQTTLENRPPNIHNNAAISNHREASTSINIKLYSPGGADCMLTVRSGAIVEEVKNVIDVFVEGAKYAHDEYKIHFAPVITQHEIAPVAASAPPTSGPAPAPTPAAPPVQGSAPGITSLTFQTEELISEIKDGVTYWKVKGPPFMKYGVRIWDEVLIEAGFALEKMNLHSYALKGYTAHYVEKETGKPNKVIKLVEN